jgi:hypothetical protein
MMNLLRLVVVEFMIVSAIYAKSDVVLEVVTVLAFLAAIEVFVLIREKKKFPIICVGVFAVGYAALLMLPHGIGAPGLAFAILITLWVPAAVVYLPFCIRRALGHPKGSA